MLHLPHCVEQAPQRAIFIARSATAIVSASVRTCFFASFGGSSRRPCVVRSWCMCVVLKEDSATKWVDWIIVRRMLSDSERDEVVRTLPGAPPNGGGHECPPSSILHPVCMPPFRGASRPVGGKAGPSDTRNVGNWQIAFGVSMDARMHLPPFGDRSARCCWSGKDRWGLAGRIALPTLASPRAGTPCGGSSTPRSAPFPSVLHRAVPPSCHCFSHPSPRRRELAPRQAYAVQGQPGPRTPFHRQPVPFSHGFIPRPRPG